MSVTKFYQVETRASTSARGASGFLSARSSGDAIDQMRERHPHCDLICKGPQLVEATVIDVNSSGKVYRKDLLAFASEHPSGVPMLIAIDFLTSVGDYDSSHVEPLLNVLREWLSQQEGVPA